MSWYFYRPYVPVAERKAKAAAYAAKLAKKEKRTLAPVNLTGRKIATTFWGQAWCENLERYSDFENRLPRGATYVRNGSVIDLQIKRGKVEALVSGSEVYKVKIDIKTLPAAQWAQIKRDCSRSFDSLADLLQGRFDKGIMERLTRRDGGLFPTPEEIKMSCSCPDWAGMCKHVAATLYGVGARLDHEPELLFTLRDVDHLELISHAADVGAVDEATRADADGALAGADLGAMFGIDLDVGTLPPSTGVAKAPRRPAAKRKPAAKGKKKTTGAKGKRSPKSR